MKNIITLSGGTMGHMIPSINISSKLLINRLRITSVKDYYIIYFLKKKIIKIKNFTTYSIIYKKRIVKIILMFFIFCKNLFYLERGVKRIKNIILYGGYTNMFIIFLLGGRNIIMQEQNFIFGITNKACNLFCSENIHNINHVYRQKYFYNFKTMIKIINICGSHGSIVVSLLVNNIFFFNNVHILCQVHNNYLKKIRKIFSDINCKYTIYIYMALLDKVIVEKDILITTSGACSLFNSLILKKTKIVVSLCNTKNDHQYKNIRQMIPIKYMRHYIENNINTIFWMKFIRNFVSERM